MSEPPPLPRRIRSAIFYGRMAGGIRFDGSKLLAEKIEDAHRQAEEWLASRPELEIISITNGHTASGEWINMVFVTVWYRE